MRCLYLFGSVGCGGRGRRGEVCVVLMGFGSIIDRVVVFYLFSAKGV